MLKAGADTCHQLPAERRGRRRLGFTLVPALAAALLPKCPLCLMGVMSAVGLSFSIKASWLLPLSLFFLLTTTVALTLQARAGRSYRTLVLGVGAVAVITSSKFYVDSNLLTYSGVVILAAHSLWVGRRKVEAADGAECDC